jgi:hypothetical protein
MAGWHAAGTLASVTVGEVGADEEVVVVAAVEVVEGEVVEGVDELVVEVVGALCAWAVLTASASMLAAQIIERRDPIMILVTAAAASKPYAAVLSARAFPSSGGTIRGRYA